MRPSGLSPYTSRRKKVRVGKIGLPSISGGMKKALLVILFIIAVIFITLYIGLGDLRFFANNYLRLTWFSKDYLILLQNNYEARPGGGFITGYGEAHTTLGIPTKLDFNNSYNVDTKLYVTPPYPHEEMLKNEWYQGYTFRDANWDPDFPTGVEEVIKFYQDKFPEKDVDGVIVVNFSMIENLVEELGDINVEGEKYDKSNLFRSITDTVNDVDRHNVKALAERKDILNELAPALISKAKWHPLKVKASIIRALKDKDLYFWFKSAGMQKKVVRRGWANALVMPENSDFLAVNIANLGSKKADRYIQKEVYHYVNITKELPEVTTEIVIRYPGFKNIYADDYKGYIRIIIPKNAQINDSLVDSQITEESDFKIIGEKIILPAGSKTTLTYTYTLPRTLFDSGEYNLRLIRQSGDEKYVWVTVEGAPDSRLESDDFEIRENRATFFEKLNADHDLSLRTLPDISSPYPIEQVFSDLKTISIYWNEPIGPSGNEALNYSIKDMDITEPNITDNNIKVLYAEVIDGSVSKLEVEGITDQKLERYQIRLTGIKDSAGNSIDPDPKNITVIQRFGKPQIEVKTTQDIPPIPTELENEMDFQTEGE